VPQELGDLLTLKELQEESGKWRDHNFPGYTAEEQLIGAMEELGELSHAYLKGKQGIRTDEDHKEAEFDAIGDIQVYLAGYCTKRGLSFQDAMEYAWAQVKNRDWQKNRKDGS
jgi:NTP pyrophosphatase (non-canonical NTP hydrolase)